MRLPTGPYACIAADPPWSFKSYAPPPQNPQSRRDVERHYDTMSIDDICAIPVRDAAARDCHLFLWTTGPNLRFAFDVIDAWGFKFSTVAFTWCKLKRSFNPAQLRVVPTIESDLHVGLGHTTRKNAEFCLLARRGSPRRIARDVRELILAPVREHSRKPDEFYDRVERYCEGPRLELFARQERPGWSAWGNETDKFGAAA